MEHIILRKIGAILSAMPRKLITRRVPTGRFGTMAQIKPTIRGRLPVVTATSACHSRQSTNIASRGGAGPSGQCRGWSPAGLECPVEETDQRGRTTRTTEARDSRRSPLSPLLANLYRPRFVLGWKKLGLEQNLGTRVVTYASLRSWSFRLIIIRADMR